MHNEDSFSDPSWPEYTQEDFEEIDRLCEEGGPQGSGIDNGAPSVLIEVEGAADENDEKPSKNRSPFEIYRRRIRYLSVTDLVSPAWCEVQFDYGLSQNRSLPVDQRPKKFVTKKGKEIHVAVDVAKANDQVHKKGKAVHRKLEKEIHKEEVVIQHSSKEERWALRLLDFLTRLKISKDGLICREVPVWAIIYGHAVFGVIDELHLEVNANSPNRNPLVDVLRAKLDSLIGPQKQDLKPPPPKPTFTIHILDNKTRFSQILPLHVDTLPSRLQLMLYRRMLKQVLAVSSDGPRFSTFCTQIGRDPKRAFSDTFIAEISQLVIQNGLNLHFLDAKCLEDMDFPFGESIKEMGLDSVDCVSPQLTLVYRLREGSVKRSRLSTDSTSEVKALPSNVINEAKQSVTGSTVVKEVPGNPDEIQDLEPDSVKVMPPMDGSIDGDLSASAKGRATLSAERTTDSPTPGGSGPLSATDLEPHSSPRKRKRDNKRASSADNELSSDTNDDDGGAASADTSSKASKGSSSFVLGRKKFQYDPNLLDAYLSTILAWWNGKRPPHGVSIEDTRRCNSCEYKDGCEWREKKALEISKKAQKSEMLIAEDRSANTERESVAQV